MAPSPNHQAVEDLQRVLTDLGSVDPVLSTELAQVLTRHSSMVTVLQTVDRAVATLKQLEDELLACVTSLRLADHVVEDRRIDIDNFGPVRCPAYATLECILEDHIRPAIANQSADS